MRYTIKEGDTLSALAKKHNTTVAFLATTNMIANPDKIYAGREIWLPNNDDHVWGVGLWEDIKRFMGW